MVSTNSARAGMLARTLVVATYLLVVLVLGGVIGTQAPAQLKESAAIRAVAPIAIAAVVLLGLAVLLLSIPSALKFIRCGGWQRTVSFVRMSLPGLLLLLVGSALAVLSMIPITQPFVEVPPAQQTPPSFGIVLGEPASHDTILVPYFPVEGRFANRAKPCDPSQLTFGAAADVSPATREALERLGRSLGACATADQRVVVDVRGFASTSEFKDCNQLDSEFGTVSNRLNLELAEARRRSVVEILSSSAGTANVIVDPPIKLRRWRSASEMWDAQNIRFLDRKDEGPDQRRYDFERGGLTRRVEVVIVNKGDCQPRPR
jgi:hypothetical protein